MNRERKSEMTDKFVKRMSVGHRDIFFSLPKLTFEEARRRSGNVYEVAIKELYEEGCKISARHVKCLIDREAELYSAKAIRDRVSSNKTMFYELIENIKMAEKATNSRDCSNWPTCFKVLLKCIEMLEQEVEKYEWLLREAFLITVQLCEENMHRLGCGELIARICFKYGIFLTREVDGLPKSINVLENTLDMTRGEPWHSMQNMLEVGNYQTLHEAVAKQLNATLMKSARIASQTNLQQAHDHATRAIHVVAEIGMDKYKVLFCRTHFKYANFLIAIFKYEVALNVLIKINHVLTPRDDVDLTQLLCEFLLLKGICYINMGQFSDALKRFRQVLKLATKYDLIKYEAEAVLNLGKVYSQNTRDVQHAKMAFERAKQLFTQLADINKKKTAVYLLAKLKADRIFPMLMDAVKIADEQFCSYYLLRQWKNLCVPFWTSTDAKMLREEREKIYCLSGDYDKEKYLMKRKARKAWKRFIPLTKAVHLWTREY